MKGGDTQFVDPFVCRLWEWHDRLDEFINESTCKDIITSFQSVGQKHAVLARPCHTKAGARYELIFGARRLFAARYLNRPLLAHVREMDDRTAFVEMDVENRLRRDLSAYERGMAFKSWLRSGKFASQDELAKTLGISKAGVCRLLKFAELPAVVVEAFGDAREIRESWAVELSERCADPGTRREIVTVARALKLERGGTRDAKTVYRLLLDHQDSKRASRVRRPDKVVISVKGSPLFRVSYRHNDIHVILPRRLATQDFIERAVQSLTSLAAELRGRNG